MRSACQSRVRSPLSSSARRAPSTVTLQPERALELAHALAQPRRVGTAGEAAAIDAIAARLAQAGCVVERQAFASSSGAQEANLLGVLVALCLVLLTLAAWGLSAWAGALSAALLLAWLLFLGRWQGWVAAGSIAPPAGEAPTRWQQWCLRLGRRYETVNVVARLPGNFKAPARPHLYLVAHSDSKSQALPLAARMLLIGLASLFAVSFAALSVVRPWVPDVTSAAALAGVAALLTGAPVLVLLAAGAGNESPGALDNASGMGLVAHLAEVLVAARPPLDVTFLVTGAEELGVVGATAYVLAAQRSGLLQRQQAGGLFVLNFDGVGSSGRLALVGGAKASRLGALVRAACAELSLPLGHLPLVGAMFDHMPFAEAGCEAVSLVTLGRAGLRVHTPADSADKLHVEGFRKAGEVALKVVERLAVQSETRD